MSSKITTKNEVICDNVKVMSAYGYIVFIAVTIISINNVLPLAAFGIVFGEFISTLGDETTGTSLANGMFNTILSLTGIIANILLNKLSCRYVGLLGALACSIGCFSLIFVHDLMSFIVFFGVFQGFGYGLLVPASLTALNNFFDKKLSFAISLSQALMVAFTMLVPPIATTAISIYGYRGTILLVGGLSLLNIPSSVALSRTSCSYKKLPKEAETKLNNNEFAEKQQLSIKCKSTDELRNVRTCPEEPLLKKHNSLKDLASTGLEEFRVLHLADRTLSVVSVTGAVANKRIIEKGDWTVWKAISTSIDLSLLRNPKYMNISMGLSLSYSSDIAFISIIPVMLSDVEFSNSDVALAMSIFFGCDLVSRSLLSIVLALRSPRSRHIVLWGSLLTAVFRVGFVMNNSFLWKTITLGALGFLRSLIQTPLPLVISEEYRNQFATAYSLFMVVCGIVTLVFGLLVGAVKSLTSSDVMVCHLLTSCYVICVISWTCEMVLGLRKSKK